MRIDEKHKQKVEKRGYGYIWTYEKGDYTLDKNIFIDKRMYIRVMCHIVVLNLMLYIIIS